MPTQDVLIPLNFGAGIDQNADAKQTLPTKLADLRNARLEKGKRISKRYGMARVAEMMDSVGTRQQGDVLGSLGDAVYVHQVNASAPDTIFGVGGSGTGNRGAALGRRDVSCTVSTQRVGVNGNDEATLVDSATLGGLTLYAFEADSLCWFQLVNDATEQILIPATSYATAVRPRVLAVNGRFLLGYVNTSTTSLEFRSLDPTAASIFPVAAASTATLVAASALAHWDWAVFGTIAGVVYNSSTATTIRLLRLSNAAAVLTSQSFTGDAPNCLTVCTVTTTGNDDFRVLWHGGAGVQLRYFNSATLAAGTAFGGVTRVLSSNATVRENITACQFGATSFAVGYQVTTATTYTRVTTVDYYNDGAPPTSASGSGQYNVGLGSKLFLRNGKMYAMTVHDSTLQKTYYISEFRPAAPTYVSILTARFLVGSAGGLTTKQHLTNVNALDADRYSIAIIRRERLILNSGTLNTFRNLGRAVLDFSTLGAHRGVNIEGTSLLTGGWLGAFDGGQSVVEHGYLLSPEYATLVHSSVGGNITTTAAGTIRYQYKVFYEWVDNRGKMHRTAPSPAFSIAPLVTSSTGTIQVQMGNWSHTLRQDQSNGRQGAIRIAIYRTEGNGTIFYRCTSSPSTQKISVVSGIAFTDTLSDAVLITNDVLYTTGNPGEVENWTPPGPTAIAASNDRVFVNDPSDDGVVFYSKPTVPGEAVAFGEEFNVRVPLEGGPITALACLDSNVLVFKKRSVYVFRGDGPDATGSTGGFSLPEMLPHDVGCDSQAACLVTPMGALVKGPSGINMLGRDLGMRNIGALVRDHQTQTVRASVLLKDRHEARIVLNNGVVLVYNYEFIDETGAGQWSVTDFDALDALSTQTTGFHAIERTSKFLYKEDSTRYTDEALGIAGADKQYSLTIQTAPIATAAIQGFQRVKRIYFLGEFKSTATLSVYLATDYGDFDPVPYTISAAAASGTNNVMQFSVQPRGGSQRCEAIAVKIVDSGSGESFNLTAMTLKVGMKPGAMRLAANRRTG